MSPGPASLTLVELLEVAANFVEQAASAKKPNGPIHGTAATLRARAQRLQNELTHAALERHWALDQRRTAEDALLAINAADETPVPSNGEWTVNEAYQAAAPPPSPLPCGTCGGTRTVHFDDFGQLARGYNKPCPECCYQTTDPT